MNNLKVTSNLKVTRITKKTQMSKILEENENAAEILFETGMGCVGCSMAMQETLEDGCKAHGMSDKEINKIVERLNKK